MPIAERTDYAQEDPAATRDALAEGHREEAMAALAAGDGMVAVVHALLSVEARLNEACVWLSRLG